MEQQLAVLRTLDGEPVALRGVTATGKVDGLLLEMAVEQRYVNAGATNIEAVYTFPLPLAAVLLDLEVRLGEKRLTAIVVEKRESEERYEKAIDKGDTAILLERAGDGLCTLNLGNLMPGEEAVIRYRYAQLLRFEQGAVRLMVSTVIAPRYGEPAGSGMQPHQAPTTDLGAAYPFALSLALAGAIAQGTIASPSHRIATTRTAGGVEVTLVDAAFLDRDFVLTVSGLPAQSLAVVAKDGDGCVALASFCAPVPKVAAEAPLRLKLVVDCSGSMGGDSIAAAKRALHRILEALTPADRFTYSRFGSTVRHEIDRFTAADAAGIRAAAARVAKTDADMGGTEMEAALESVYKLGGREGSADVFLITDGEIWAADALFAGARAAKQRIFVVGIGSSPNEALVQRLAQTTGGACEFIAPNEDAEAGILRMFARLRGPRIAGAQVAWPIAPRWTTPLPETLFGGETIHVFAGFDAPPSGAATLQLRSAAGGEVLAASVTLPARIGDDVTLARMAAASRIVGSDEATQLALALQYALLTDRTNFLVVHERAEGEKAQDLPTLAKVAQMHAAGWGGVGSVAPKVSAVHCLRVPRLNVDFADLADLEVHLEGHFEPGSAASLAPDTGAEADWIDQFLFMLDERIGGAGRVVLPTTLADLGAVGAPDALLAAVDALRRDGFAESHAVAAILEALAPRAAALALSRQLVRELRNALRGGAEHARLRQEAAEAVERLAGANRGARSATAI